MVFHPLRPTTLRSAAWFIGLTLTAGPVAWAQQRPPVREGAVDNQEITIEKNRRIELPPASRLFDKGQPVRPAPGPRRLTYEFQDRMLTVGEPTIRPNILPVTATQPAAAPTYPNYLKVGAGNYGTFYGEGFMGLQAAERIGVEGSLRHLSSATGPVDGRNSAQSDTRLKVTGRYGTNAFKATGSFAYDREQFYFYGYGPALINGERRVPDRESIRQRLQTARLQVGIENQQADRILDYSLRTGLTTLRDAYQATELDWATNLTGSVGISDRVVALLAADAFLTQRTDGPIDNRNLFRVRPAFKYTTPRFTITAGLNAVNETDRRLAINRTRAFPVVDVDVTPTGAVHVFAGVDGDIQRNTLRSLLDENRWLAPRVLLANTTKLLDVYGGTKGQLGGGFRYEGRVSYATYRNFTTFNNAWPDTTRFFVLYDGGVSRVLTVSGQLGYDQREKFRSNLKVDIYNYGMDRLEAAWGRPQLAGVWNNTYILNKKLFVTADLYYYQGIRQKNFVTGLSTTLPPIYDLNLKIDYFLGKQLAAFVSLNNILGRNYQRFLYYPVQGLNFLGGISYSF